MVIAGLICTLISELIWTVIGTVIVSRMEAIEVAILYVLAVDMIAWCETTR